MTLPDLQNGRILWSYARLGDEFGVDWRTIRKRIMAADVHPVGEKKGKPIYLLKDAAPAILKDKVIFAADADIKDMAPDVRDKHYAAELKRIQLEKEEGTLISVEDYRDDLASTFKALVQFVDTLPDVLDRDCELSGVQVEQLQKLCDLQRDELYKTLTNE